MRTKKKSIYMPYKQTCVYGVPAGRRLRGIELYRRQKTYFMYDRAGKQLQFGAKISTWRRFLVHLWK